MHRPAPSARSARANFNSFLKSMTSFAAMAADAVLAALVQAGVYNQAERENRRRIRDAERLRRHSTYFDAGLNGKRAVARRQRQIAAGSLREANGLVRDQL